MHGNALIPKPGCIPTRLAAVAMLDAIVHKSARGQTIIAGFYAVERGMHALVLLYAGQGPFTSDGEHPEVTPGWPGRSLVLRRQGARRMLAGGHAAVRREHADRTKQRRSVRHAGCRQHVPCLSVYCGFPGSWRRLHRLAARDEYHATMKCSRPKGETAEDAL